MLTMQQHRERETKKSPHKKSFLFWIQQWTIRNKNIARLFPVAPRARARGNGIKAEHRRFRLHTRKHFCAVRVTEQGTGCPDAVQSSPWRSPKASWAQAWAPCYRWPCWGRSGTRCAKKSWQPQSFCIKCTVLLFPFSSWLNHKYWKQASKVWFSRLLKCRAFP